VRREDVPRLLGPVAGHARVLRAAWLGHWQPPWGLGKGRRFGDLSWAFAAVGMAWLQGGKDGLWPRQAWTFNSSGPRPQGEPTAWTSKPDPKWVSLLRHGSESVPPGQPAAREDVLDGMAWEALLKGDPWPFLHLALVHIDLDTRFSWIPCLGALGQDGTLHLPPYLSPLILDDLKQLPPGWWEILLSGMDPKGLLLPQGVPPEWLSKLSSDALIPLLSPAPIPEIPDVHQHRTPEGRWVIDPSIRAWFRGEGPRGSALRTLQPMTLGLGADPDPRVRALLDFDIPPELPEAWQACLRADLLEQPTPSAPEPLNHPTWDWLRVRWGGELPTPQPGYPGPLAPVGGSCDPYSFFALGRYWYRQGEVEKAMLSSMFAHSHLRRLKSPAWAERAAFNASWEAYFWGDVQKSQFYRCKSGPTPFPYSTLQEIHDQILLGEFRKALDLIPSVENHPKAHQQAMVLRVHALLNLGKWEAVKAIDRPSIPRDLRLVVEALHSGHFQPRPEGLDEEHALLWESLRARLGDYQPESFWGAWEACPNALLRLGAGLLVMEAQPSARIPQRLLNLQELAHRCGSPALLARLAALWPKGAPAQDRSPAILLETMLSRHFGPAWVMWGDEYQHRIGQGEWPPESLLDLLPHAQSWDPLGIGEWMWWGRLLQWEGAPLGWVMLGFPLDQPFELPAWIDLLDPWVAALTHTSTPPLKVEGEHLLTNGSEPMASLLHELNEVAPSRLPILLLGPTGSGKELAAQEVHARSGRKGPLVPVNCSAFAPGVLESELFGHVKGAFTGAARDKVGAIESARGGTLFLDEVADLDPRLQSMLLRVLQEREVRRVGSDRAVQVDVRFIAATHRDLDRLVHDGLFRKDLLFRLQGATLRLPSLDERRHELPWLLPRLVVRICREEQLPLPTLAQGLSQALARRSWPGNFRELRHVLQRALLRAQGGTLSVSHFPELQEPDAPTQAWENATRAFQRKLLLDTLRAQEFQVAETARTLGLARPALYAAAKRLGVDLIAERHKDRKSH
jgi:DNA-binding NtrC family response regulator